MNKSLQELLNRVDAFKNGSINKTASEATSSNEVMKLAEELISASSNTELEKVAKTTEENTPEVFDTEFDEVAIAVNRLEAIEQVKTMKKIAEFREQATAAGHSEQAIEEEIEKIAAEKVLEILPLLVPVAEEVE